MTLGYYDDETTRRAADESLPHAGTVEQGQQWQSRPRPKWLDFNPDLLVALVCTAGIVAYGVALVLGA